MFFNFKHALNLKRETKNRKHQTSKRRVPTHSAHFQKFNTFKFHYKHYTLTPRQLEKTLSMVYNYEVGREVLINGFWL